MNFYAFLPKLLNMSLTASITIVCVLLLRLLLKKAPKVISYALWAVVLFRLLCPVSISSNFSLFGFMDVPITDTATRTSSIEYVPENIVHTEVPEVTIPVPGVSETINNALPEGREQLAADPLEAPMAIGTYVWIAGVLAMAGYSVVSYVRLKKKLLIVSPLRANIYLADEITTPFVMGLIRPKIYLPSDMEEGQQSYIILHEQHHIRRGDHIIKALAFLALSIHWFNPLVWVAFLYSNKDMEMSCDEAVVKKMGDGILADYTASLLSLATGKRIIAGMPLAFGEGDTKGRIRNLANWKRPTFWVVLVAMISCIVLGIGLLTNPTREYQIRITIPAGSAAAFCYSDEEISPQGDVLKLENGDGLGDTEVILLPVEVQEENTYEPTYMTPGMPVKMEVEKGAWYKIGVNMQNPTTEDIDVYVSVKNVEIRIAEKDDAGSENDVYGDIIAGLGDEDTYAFLVMNYEHNVLLTSDLVYDEGTEKQAAISCDVYYTVDGAAKKLGSIMSDGTAYPITFTKDGIFAASGHKVEKYEISQEGVLYLKKGVYEQFDEAGNATYISGTGEQEGEVTEQEYQELVEEYAGSQIVHFSYGAEGSVNEYQENETALNVNDPDTEHEETNEELVNVEKRDVTHDGVLDYIVTSMTYYPTDVDTSASLEERIAQHVMYNVVCVKVYDGQDGSGAYSEEYLLWSQDYSRVHVGNGQLSIVQIEGKDYLLTSSLWGGQGFASWDFELFSLNASGGKEVIDTQSVGFEIGTEDSVMGQNAFQDSLNQYIGEGILIVACDIDFEEQFVRTQENPFIPKDYYGHAFSKYNGEESVEMQEPDSGKAAMVDVTAVSSIVVTNGNTGEQRTLTAADDYYTLYDLTKLYQQLDFTAEHEENTRVGYQYTMKLQDADGNTLQKVTPYKDGLTVDRTFFQYDNTEDGAAASLSLMDYLENLFNPE